MNPLESILLGATQGITEFIPVSSSGHLSILQAVLGSDPNTTHLFLEFINLGTLLALLIYFRKEIWAILVDIFKHHNFKLATNILVTAIPAGIIGLLFSDFIEQTEFFGALPVVAIAMLLIGIIMIILNKLPRASAVKDGAHLSKPRALLIGLAQTIALIPGVSRSGATIIAGRLSGLEPDQAAEYSFLASIPLMVGVVGKTILSDHSYLSANLASLSLANATAFLTGLLALVFIFKYLKKHESLQIFGIYRIALATGLLISLLI